MVVKLTLTTGNPIMTAHHVECVDVYALAKYMNTGPFRLFSMAYDVYACNKNVLIDDYANFRTNGIIPAYVASYVIIHTEHRLKHESLKRNS